MVNLNRRRTLKYLERRKKSLELSRYIDRTTQLRLIYPKLIKRYGDAGEDFTNLLISMGWSPVKAETIAETSDQNFYDQMFYEADWDINDNLVKAK